MYGFTKLFGDIVTSSIWSEDDKTRILWVTLLAIAGPDGVARAAIPGLATVARMSVPECEAAMLKLEGPDKYSRSQEHEGRRVQRVNGGYLILNYLKYRNDLDKDKRREYKARKQAEYRTKKRNPRAQVSAQFKEREERFVEAAGNGDARACDRIAAEGL